MLNLWILICTEERFEKTCDFRTLKRKVRNWFLCDSTLIFKKHTKTIVKINLKKNKATQFVTTILKYFSRIMSNIVALSPPMTPLYTRLGSRWSCIFSLNVIGRIRATQIYMLPEFSKIFINVVLLSGGLWTSASLVLQMRIDP